ncbi:MAG TPA: hypothetical protein VM285_09385, partial [Polyangia bacterium]|nr:hypothetical protein [Polyangia bacterium]
MIHDPGFLGLDDFLAVFGEPRARLEQAAVRPTPVLDGSGRVVMTMAVHRGELVRLLRLRAAVRNKHLRPFRRWLRDSEGFSARTARDCISEVGAAIADTGGQPEAMAVNMARGMRYRLRLGRWLELLTRYLLRIENVDDRIESWAWNIRSFLELSAPRRPPASREDEPSPRPHRELTEDEESALAAQVQARRGFGDHPAWVWPVLELLLCSGAGIAEIVRLER